MRRWDAEAVRRALQLYLVMGSVNTTRDPVEVLRQAITGGITLFQFREKGTGALTGEARLALALRLREVCSQHRIPFIVNDDVELAVAVEADGVHVGQEDADAALVRARIGEGRMLGVSAHSALEARHAVQAGADYLGVGPMYPTRSKADAHAVLGPAGVAELRAAGIAVPVVGIGGITPDTAAAVMAAEADGIAVISAIAGAADVHAATAQLAAITRTEQA
ncbi:thiamine phosphate synthase [Paenibacillus amylolyticus]|uniref:Thiamine-phosphate synthase n=1 Tax=Paenibacillus amylolyticus TaxID=1451 RepID=A0A5M9WN44_PAEAM|nr:thiamine phosphate synthase [Paenibacillus amylolyticus]KAA8782981.1 thiamine phosphate synthase [Paenibacillus amylolyticus]